MTSRMACVAPRSTSSHCGSLKALDQRVLRFPSTALAAAHGSPWIDDAVTGCPWDSRTTGVSDGEGAAALGTELAAGAVELRAGAGEWVTRTAAGAAPAVLLAAGLAGSRLAAVPRTVRPAGVLLAETVLSPGVLLAVLLADAR